MALDIYRWALPFVDQPAILKLKETPQKPSLDENREHTKVIRRKKFHRTAKRKTPLYENCRMLAPDGIFFVPMLLCTLRIICIACLC